MTSTNKIIKFFQITKALRFLLPVGIIFIIAGIFIASIPTDQYVEGTGVVINIETKYDATDELYEDEVTFLYNVESKAYSSSLITSKGKYQIGDTVSFYYDPENPANTSSNKTGPWFGFIFIGLGAIAVVCGVLIGVKNFKKARQLENDAPIKNTDPNSFYDTFTSTSDENEYYCQFDGKSFKPGYLIDDKNRTPIFEIKMVQNNPFKPRVYDFINHTTSNTKTHEVTHTMTSSIDNEVFSQTSWFKFDGTNIWDYLHQRGIRIETDLFSKFPNMHYTIYLNGERYASFYSTSQYVHEEDEAGKKVKIPIGRMYYRIFTHETDLELIALVVFAVSETEQVVVD